MDFDLVIRDGNAVTATEEVFCDIGVERGTIAAIGKKLGKGKREINADGFAGTWESRARVNGSVSTQAGWSAVGSILGHT